MHPPGPRAIKKTIRSGLLLEVDCYSKWTATRSGLLLEVDCDSKSTATLNSATSLTETPDEPLP